MGDILARLICAGVAIFAAATALSGLLATWRAPDTAIVRWGDTLTMAANNLSIGLIAIGGGAVVGVVIVGGSWLLLRFRQQDIDRIRAYGSMARQQLPVGYSQYPQVIEGGAYQALPQPRIMPLDIDSRGASLAIAPHYEN